MAVFAPMPRASVSTATAVKPGFFSNWRKANLKSFMVRCQWSVVRCPIPPGFRPLGFFPISDFEFRISFISQRLHRIDFGRATCRQITRDERDHREQPRNHDEGDWISRADAEEQ